MRDELEKTLARFEELERSLMDPEVQASPGRMSAAAREHGSLAKVATKYRRFKQSNAQIAEALEMLHGEDPELRVLAEAELPVLKADREAQWSELWTYVGGEDANRNQCILEIRAGTGGDEAGLFARDLYEMYKHYADAKRLENRNSGMQPHRIRRLQGNDLGRGRRRGLPMSAIRERRPSRAARPGNRGQGPRPYFGRHRGRHGRARGRGNRIRPEDYTQSNSGQRPRRAARQQDLQRPSASRTWPRASRSPARTRRASTRTWPRPCALRSRVYEVKREEENRKRSDERRTKIGSGDRSQRIRTYNFPQNRLTDHRLNQNFNLENVIAGNLDPLVDALIECERQAQPGGVREYRVRRRGFARRVLVPGWHQLFPLFFSPGIYAWVRVIHPHLSDFAAPPPTAAERRNRTGDPRQVSQA